MKTLSNLVLLLCLLTAGNLNAQNQIQGDIDYNSFINPMRDDDRCRTDFYSNSHVIVSNSFIGDSIKFIDYNSMLFYTEVNVNGANPWMVNPPFSNMMSSVEDYSVVNGIAYGSSSNIINKIISGPDTLYVANIGMPFQVLNPCTYGTISGKVYIDQNTDCVFDASDLKLQNVNIRGNGNFTAVSSGYTMQEGANSNNSGDYSIRVQQNWMNNFTVQMPSIYAFIFPLSSCNALSYTYTSLPQTNANFAVQCADIDLSVSVQTSGLIRPMVPFRLFPHASNVGCDPISGTLKLLLDPNVTYSAANSSNPPSSISGDTMIWNYSNLSNISNGAYWNSFFGSIHLTPNLNVNAGDILSFKVWTHTPGNDVNATNNSYILNRTVVNSYDPNIKEVLPKGTGAENYISATTPKLKYTIHFQNTGTANAINIRVVDTLGMNIIPNTMRVLSSSHTMIPNWLNNNVIEFKFNNIQLADSLTNEPASHGFVTFEVDMVQGLAPETRIENKAFIYFDYNAPIETPTAFNTIANPLHVGDILKSTDMEITVYPNPAKDIVNFSINGEANDMELSIRDISGKLIFTQAYSNTKLITVDSEFMSSGVYFYQLRNKNTNQNSNGKLIVN